MSAATTHQRFHVTHPLEGLIATARKRDDAQVIAERWIPMSGYHEAYLEVRIFDVMAQWGKINEWALVGKKWKPAGRRVALGGY